MTDLFIKNMVCNRCILAVKQELINHGFHPVSVELGVARITDTLDNAHRVKLSKSLDSLGFELLDGMKSRLVEQLKKLIIKKIHYSEYLDIKVNWSDLLADELHHDYKHLSSLFSAVEGITLEQYIIRLKIEKVKELLFYDELNLSEISYRLGYSSVQHLSFQFKKITGQTPSQFKASRSIEKFRKPLDGI